MAAFFLANGFERCFNEDDYEKPVFHGTWGVSDEDLMRRANELFVAHGERTWSADRRRPGAGESARTCFARPRPGRSSAARGAIFPNGFA